MSRIEFELPRCKVHELAKALPARVIEVRAWADRLAAEPNHPEAEAADRAACALEDAVALLRQAL